MNDAADRVEFDDTPCDVPYWFGTVPNGCDVPGWIPFMTADELGLSRPKLMIDSETGEPYVSYPVGKASSCAAPTMGES